MLLRRFALSFWVVTLLVCSGCKVSFTGVAVQPDVKTLTIEQFDNNAPLSLPTLSQVVSNAVRDKFINQSRLALAPTGGDLRIRGVITNYTIQPQNITGGNQAVQNRITLTVRVKFENTKYPDQNWDESFTAFQDIAADSNLATVETALIADLSNRMAQDIFNKALSDW